MKKTGIYFATISNIERGWLQPTEAQTDGLAKVLRVDKEWLFPQEQSK